MAKRIGPLLLFLPLLASSARADWVVAGYLGSAFTQRSYLTIEQPALNTALRFHGVEYQGESFDPPLYYGFRGGYYFGPHVGIEAEFIHLKVYAKVDGTVQVDGLLAGERLNAEIPMSSIVQRFSISHGVNLLMGNFVYRWNLIQRGREPARLFLAARFGIGGTVPHPESEILGVSNEHYQGGRWALQAAGGAEVRLWRGLYGVGEYKYTRTGQRVRIYEGHAETLLNSHHVVFGLACHF